MSAWTDERNAQVALLREIIDDNIAVGGGEYARAIAWAIQRLEGLPEHWIAADPPSPSMKKIERIHNGEWEDVEFEDLRTGDVFRIITPAGDPNLYTALDRAHPISGQPGNWSVRTERVDSPPGLTPRA